MKYSIPQKRNFWLIVGFLIAAFNLWSYWPSLGHTTRADHTVYLVELADYEGFWESLNYSYSYTRNRIIFQGDQFLFRPGWYLIVSLERWLFGMHFHYWQGVGLLLHGIILYLLGRVLYLLYPSRLVAGFVLLFSVLILGCDMVVWHHMHGYLLGMIWLLLGIIAWVKYQRSLQRDNRTFWIMMLWLLLGCFTFEFGVVANIILFGSMFLQRLFKLKNTQVSELQINFRDQKLQKARLFLTLAPALTYLYMSWLDYSLRFAGTIMPSKMTSFTAYLQPDLVFMAIKIMVLFGVVGPCIPMFIQLFPGLRTELTALHWQEMIKIYDPTNPYILLNCGVLILLFGLAIYVIVDLIRRGIRTRVSPSQAVDKWLLLTCFVLGAGYQAILFVGRFGSSSFGYIINSIYHFYFIYLFYILVLYGLIGLLLQRFQLNFRKKISSVILVVCLSLAFLNGYQTRQFNKLAYEFFAPWGVFMSQMQNFIDQHKGEPGFKFDFFHREFVRPFSFRLGDPLEGRLLEGVVSQYVFRKYMDVEQPKYIVSYFQNEGLSIFGSVAEARAHYEAKISTAD